MEDHILFANLPPLFNDNDDSLFLTDPTDELNDSIFYTESNQTTLFLDNSPLRSRPDIQIDSKPVASRKNRKDNFDYDSYIKTELSKHGSSEMDSVVKKRMIQKIRNRMSAQRSRQRQKNLLQILEQENLELKTHNTLLYQQLMTSQAENAELKETIKRLEEAKRAPSVSETDETMSISSLQDGFRTRASTGSSINRGLLFLAIAALACVLMPPSGGESSPVKMSGVVPFIGNKISSNSPTQLKTIEAQCQKYCSTCGPSSPSINTGNSIQIYSEQVRQMQPYLSGSMSTLVCFDPSASAKAKDAFRVVVDDQTRKTLDPNEFYFADLQKISSTNV